MRLLSPSRPAVASARRSIRRCGPSRSWIPPIASCSTRLRRLWFRIRTNHSICPGRYGSANGPSPAATSSGCRRASTSCSPTITSTCSGGLGICCPSEPGTWARWPPCTTIGTATTPVSSTGATAWRTGCSSTGWWPTRTWWWRPRRLRPATWSDCQEAGRAPSGWCRGAWTRRSSARCLSPRPTSCSRGWA